MELQIQDLVSSIRKEGIEKAQEEAGQILAQARAEADKLIAQAKAEAARTGAAAEADIETRRQGAQVAVEQAKRDALLSFEASVQGEFKKILAADVAKTVKGETLAKLIAAALGDEDPAAYTAEVAEVTEGLKGELAQKVRDGLEIKAVPGVKAGFRLAAKDGSGFFDCSAEELARMLEPFFAGLQI